MESKKPEPRPQHVQPPAARDDVRVEANRCPFCHDDVTPTESVVCQSCLARHHDSCWGESKACASCQGTAILRPAPKVSGMTVAALGFALLVSSLTNVLDVVRGDGVSTLGALSMGMVIASFMVVCGLYLRYRTRSAD